MSKKQPKVLFNRITLIGIGLIGSSIARRVKRDGLANHISVNARTQESLDKAVDLGIADEISLDQKDSVKDSDLIIICSPIGAYGDIIKNIPVYICIM